MNLMDEIDIARSELYKYIYSDSSDTIVEFSQKLDRLIVRYYNEVYGFDIM